MIYRSLLFLLLLVSAAWAQPFVRMSNKDRSGQELNVQNGSLEISATQPGWFSADWVFEATGVANTFRIKNRYRNTYINVEKGLAASDVPAAFVSSQWVVEPVDGGYCRLRNAWKTGSYLHFQGESLGAGAIDPKLPSALWSLKGMAVNEIPVGKAQFEGNLNLKYSYEIKESTKGERLAVGAWDGAYHRLRRWSRTGNNEQRFVVLPVPLTSKIRLQTLREDVNDRIWVGISDNGVGMTWTEATDNSQLFEVVWQPDGLTFALREGTRSEYLDMDSGGGAGRWAGLNGSPKSNQLFQFLNPRSEAKAVSGIEAQLGGTDIMTDFLPTPYLPIQPGVAGNNAGGGIALHVNGMAVLGDGSAVLNYPWVGGAKGDLYWWRPGSTNWNIHTFDMVDKATDEDRFPGGMQASGDLLAVADNKYIRIFRLNGTTAQEMTNASFKVTSGNAEVVGMAYHPQQDRYYVITPKLLLRSSQGQFNANSRFTSLTTDQKLAFGEAGLALVYDASEQSFLCLSLGTDKGWKLKAYRIKLNAGGDVATVTELFEKEMPRPSAGQAGDDGLGSGPSFRWGGTARLDGERLELFAAPKRLDNVLGNVSRVLRWRLGPRF